MTRERSLAEGADDAKPAANAPPKRAAPPRTSAAQPVAAKPRDPLALHRLLDSFGVLSTYRAKLFAAVLAATLVPSFVGIVIAMFGAHRMSVGTLIVLLFLLAIAGAAFAVWSVHRLLAPLDAARDALDAHAERRDVARIDIAGTDTAAQLVRGVQSLVAQIKSQDDERHKRESRDSTTGLYSRSAGRSKAQALIDHHCKHGRAVRVIAVRIDSFGAFNDAQGYGHGDALLKAVAARIDRVAGQDGVSMRWSGDEFMLARAVSPGEPADFVEGLGRSIVLKGADAPITLSLGVAQTDTSVPFESLAARAEEMLVSERRRRAERAGG
jgi:diguanylate cyclase (GGDEF)-like protein